MDFSLLFSFLFLSCESRTTAPPFQGECSSSHSPFGGKGTEAGGRGGTPRLSGPEAGSGHREEPPPGQRVPVPGPPTADAEAAGAGEPEPSSPLPAGGQVRGRGRSWSRGRASPGLGAPRRCGSAVAAAVGRAGVAGGRSLRGSEQGLLQLSAGGAGRWRSHPNSLSDGRLQFTNAGC